jgi:CheY-like chemotaxis protein
MTIPSVALMQSEIGVLVVCSYPELLAAINFLLSSSGFQVLTASTGQEAIRVYQQRHDEIDVVLMNRLLVGGMDGPQAFEALKTIDPKVRCVFMSGCPEEDWVDDVMRRGAVGYVLKPFRLPDFVTLLRDCSLR